MGMRLENVTAESATVRCNTCSEVVFPDAVALANLVAVGTSDGRTMVYSTDFNHVVHLCAEGWMEGLLTEESVPVGA